MSMLTVSLHVDLDDEMKPQVSRTAYGKVYGTVGFTASGDDGSGLDAFVYSSDAAAKVAAAFSDLAELLAIAELDGR